MTKQFHTTLFGTTHSNIICLVSAISFCHMFQLHWLVLQPGLVVFYQDVALSLILRCSSLTCNTTVTQTRCHTFYHTFYRASTPDTSFLVWCCESKIALFWDSCVCLSKGWTGWVLWSGLESVVRHGSSSCFRQTHSLCPFHQRGYNRLCHLLCHRACRPKTQPERKR